MSKYVNEIIKDLKENPESFYDYKGRGLTKGNLKITGYGNTSLLSVIWLYINGKDMPITYIDKWKLESAIRNWYRSSSFSILSK